MRSVREQTPPTEAGAVVEQAPHWAPFEVLARLQRAKFLADYNRWNEVIRVAPFVVCDSKDEKLLHSAR